MATIAELRKKWDENKKAYKTKEVGSGVHSFIADVFEAAELFGLKKTAANTGKLNTFVHDTEAGEKGRPDFVLYVSNDFSVPVEAKCYERINEGVQQLQRYQLDTAKRYKKQYGILTDGYEWRFYRASSVMKFLLPDILNNPKDFLTFWQGYINAENYYVEILHPSGQQRLFEEQRININDSTNRSLFFDDITHLIENFKAKMKAIGTWDLFTNADKVATETSYAYLIQFILYKVLVDNGYSKFKEQYDAIFRGIKLAIKNEDLYRFITQDIRIISEYISKHIYKPFAKEQESINEKLMEKLVAQPTIDEIAPWLDIIIFIDKYDFSDIRNEIFGFVYENYLKDLYKSENKGQYFTDPAVVNFMLDQIGYTEKNLAKDESRISLIDPSCGAGTFLYSAVDRIINAYTKNGGKNQSEIVQSLVDANIFGLDIEEFPLFLAEMSILMRLLPFIVNDDYENPIDNKLKIFKTKDSISEFLDTGISSNVGDVSLFEHIKATALDYPSFMRDENDLQEMLESLQNHMSPRRRFDYVIGNPPYVGYNECCKQGISFVKKIQDKNNLSITMGDVYGVNLNTVPGTKKPYAPKPNLYAFFIALGLALLKDDGKICYVIPQTLLTAGDLDVLRYHLAKHTTIEKIVTFSGKLFIGRGLTQKKPILTSSLVLVGRKAAASKNHVVKITNFNPYTEKQTNNLDMYFHSRNKVSKEILQTELLDSMENWNFIKHEDTVIQFCNKYTANTKSMEEYRSGLKNYDEIQFDKGLVFDKKNIDVGFKHWDLIKKYKDRYTMGLSGNYLDTKFIRLPRGSQGLSLFENKYKVVWSYMNFDKFYFSDEKIMLDFNWVFISSNNKMEILFFLAILNSTLSARLFDFYLRNENEQAILLGIKSIKNYIRIPNITSVNQAVKTEIIKQTEAMLALEKVTLRDIVDFNEISAQKFDSAAVSGNDLVLCRDDKKYRCKIQKGKSELVAGIVIDAFGNLVPSTKISLSALKSTPVLDNYEQTTIKNYIDDLVFALYFSVKLSNIGIGFAPAIRKACEKNEFYQIVKDD